VSIKYVERLIAARPDPSVGRVDDSSDNAESINGLYKAEVIQRRGPWCNLEVVESATLECVDRFSKPTSA
jgi:putative transposase